MTPRRFMALTKPFLKASLRARNAVLGSPTQVLHDIEKAPARDAQPRDSTRATQQRVISRDGSAIGC